VDTQVVASIHAPRAPHPRNDVHELGARVERWLEHASAAQARRRVRAELEGADRRVKSHEQRHLAAAGVYAESSAVYTYAGTGRRLVRPWVDRSRWTWRPSPETRRRRSAKAMRSMRAALSPGDPSAADMRVAAEAYRMAAAAKREIETSRDSSPGQLLNLLA